MATATTYVTQQGDQWDLISFRVYSTEIYANVLIDANPTYNDTIIFDAGVSLTVPPMTTVTPLVGLPPWISAAQVS